MCVCVCVVSGTVSICSTGSFQLDHHYGPIWLFHVPNHMSDAAVVTKSLKEMLIVSVK